MKSKSLRRTLAIAMSAATLLTSAVSLNAFAANDAETVQAASASKITYVEDHSVIDCVNRYKMNDGKFNFTIKVPKGYTYSQVKIAVLMNNEGIKRFTTTMHAFSYATTLIRSDDTHDYYEIITDKTYLTGAGIKLYCEYNGGYYMATDNANGSTKEGRGYWLDA